MENVLQEQHLRISVDKTEFKEMSFVQVFTNQNNSPALTGDGMLPYISEVDRIRIMRNHYKKDTQKYLNDDIYKLLEKKKSIKLQTANKLKLLVDYNKSILNHMDNQRTANGKIISECAKMSNSFIETSHMKEQNEHFMLVGASIKNLLSDLKQ